MANRIGGGVSGIESQPTRDSVRRLDSGRSRPVPAHRSSPLDGEIGDDIARPLTAPHPLGNI